MGVNMLEQLLGGGQQQEYQDFAAHYTQGAPHEGYADQEVLQRDGQIARTEVEPRARPRE